MTRLVTSCLALSTALTTSAYVLADGPLVASDLYASASIEDRVAERKARRQGGGSDSGGAGGAELLKVIDRKQRRPSNRMTVEQRRQARLNKRTVVPSVRRKTPLDTKSVLDRRAERRNRRLAGQPVPVKILVADAVNLERAKLGIAPMSYQIKLQTSAQLHAEDMKNRDYFSHENPEGKRSGDRIKDTGYGVINAQECRCSYRIFLGENIAKGQSTVEQVVREWMESQSHREAMLSEDYNEIGVGIIDDIWVLNFGKIEINPVHSSAR